MWRRRTLRSGILMRILPVLLLLCPLTLQAADWTTRALAELAVFAEFRAPAAVVAREEARLAAEVGARIVAMPAREGETVAPGAELARLDSASYRLDVDRAQAQLRLIDRRIALARVQLDQSRALAGRGFISTDGLRIRETELEVLVAERDAAQAGLAAAELALARCVIRAPYAGVVRERHAAVGDLAVPGTPLITLAASVGAEVRAQVPAVQVASLQSADGLALLAGGNTHGLRLRRVSPLLDLAGQVRQAVLEAAEPLPPGLAGELRWRSTAPQLPPAYVQQRDEALGAWIERDGAPVFVVLPQAQAGRPVTVDWPLTTRLIDEGRFTLPQQATR